MRYKVEIINAEFIHTLYIESVTTAGNLINKNLL